MVDVERIGRRIKEQRKLRGESQTLMADKLCVHQETISNLENAKSGSGISDLYKLDTIAQYFDMPLETLIFGIGGDDVQKYYGDKMTIKRSKRPLKAHLKVLSSLIGCSVEMLEEMVSPTGFSAEEKEALARIPDEDWQKLSKLLRVPIDVLKNYSDALEQIPVEDRIRLSVYTCGPYTIYSWTEEQRIWGGENLKTQDGVPLTQFPLPILHTWIFYDRIIVAAMTAAVTTIMQHVYRPALEQLFLMIPPEAMDPADVYGTLNPYWRLQQYPTNDEDLEKNRSRMFQRMDELRSLGEDDTILYVETVYVSEDYRQNGIFRMYVDYLRLMYGREDTILWLNLEPTTGDEMAAEYRMTPLYIPSDVGQFSMNAYVAEKLGFAIDPKVFNGEVAIEGDDGEFSFEPVQARMIAYLLPKKYKDLLAQDNDLVAVSRVRQQIAEKAFMASFDEDDYNDDDNGDGVDI